MAKSHDTRLAAIIVVGLLFRGFSFRQTSGTSLSISTELMAKLKLLIWVISRIIRNELNDTGTFTSRFGA